VDREVEQWYPEKGWERVGKESIVVIVYNYTAIDQEGTQKSNQGPGGLETVVTGSSI